MESLEKYGPAFLIGLAMGYAIKKAFKIFLFVFGIIAIIALSSGFELSYLQGTANFFKDYFLKIIEMAKDGLNNIPLKAASGVAGFALGIKMG